MKIITGFLKGKTINDYKIEGTKPTMDRVKESIFSTVQEYIYDSVCLDLFAGSGNLGIEAISEGARKCYFIDNNSKAIEVIKKNVNKFNIEKHAVIIKSDYKKILEKIDKKFDIIFLDPPYKMKIINNILKDIYKYDLLNENGIIICEYEFDEIKSNYYNLIKEKKYGSKKVSIFKRGDKE